MLVPPSLGAPARLRLSAADEGDTHGMMLGQSHHHQRVWGGLLRGVLPRWWPGASVHCGLGAGEWPQFIGSQGAVAGGLSSLGGQHRACHLLSHITTLWCFRPAGRPHR